jgi:hypothetical protein
MHLAFQLFLLEQSSVGFILFTSSYLHCRVLDLYACNQLCVCGMWMVTWLGTQGPVVF